MHYKDIIRMGGCILFIVNSEKGETSEQSPAFYAYTRELLYRSLDQNSILLGEIAYQLNSISDVKTALRTISSLIEMQMGAEKCQVILPEEFEKLNKLGFSSTFARHAIKNNSAFVLPEINPDLDNNMGDSVRTLHIRSILCVPILAEEKCIALLYMYKSDPHALPFSQQDLQLAIAISHQASLTIQRMKLMERIRQEQQARILLERFVSHEVAEYLLTDKNTTFHLPGLKNQHVTVLFVDIEDSTRMAESLGSEIFSQILDSYYKELTNIIFSNNGFVKYIGDGMMSVFGMTKSDKNHACRSIQSSIELLAAIEIIATKFQANIRVGIGINSGNVMAGFVGTYQQGEITVLGDVVNVANGLQAHARPNKILIGSETKKSVGEQFWTTKVGPIKIKKRDQPIIAYEVLDRK